ncbi:MAG: hypothetical protein ACE5QW_09445 [Thermoplasmata archaeon]
MARRKVMRKVEHNVVSKVLSNVWQKKDGGKVNCSWNVTENLAASW